LELAKDRRFGFMFDPVLLSMSFGDVLSNILRLPSNGKPISIIDLARTPSEIIGIVVAAISRLIFNYAIWSRGETLKPVLLICEEAQNYLPSEEKITSSSARKILERIAKEGRKYGVSLGLVSQRPSDLAEGALSQCGTVIATRLNSEHDLAYIRSFVPETGRHLIEVIQSLRNRECIICGEGVSIPVRVRIDVLEDSLKLSSNDPVFSDLWKESGSEEEIISRTIFRWLNQVL
jgi:uncharacterized protein